MHFRIARPPLTFPYHPIHLVSNVYYDQVDIDPEHFIAVVSEPTEYIVTTFLRGADSSLYPP